jgi:hypothetical protein
VREGSGQLVLREIEDRDLGVLFEHATDPEAIRMAAFTSPEADDRTSFDRRWARLRSDVSVKRTRSCSDSMHDSNCPRMDDSLRP